jgi:site-specific recombinase XerD
MQARTLTVVSGKGNKDRVNDLEKKVIQAMKNYLAVRPSSLDEHVFLNYEGIGISDRGVKKFVEKYRVAAGIEKKASAHSLRHTFGTYKTEKGVSPFQLKEWLGHSSVATTQIYVHTGRQAGKKAMEATSLWPHVVSMDLRGLSDVRGTIISRSCPLTCCPISSNGSRSPIGYPRMES